MRENQQETSSDLSQTESSSEIKFNEPNNNHQTQKFSPTSKKKIAGIALLLVLIISAFSYLLFTLDHQQKFTMQSSSQKTTQTNISSIPNQGTYTASQGMRVTKNQLRKDGSLFIPHGFNMIGVLAPPGCNQRLSIIAKEHFGQTEMTAAKQWHANILRFQISQSGLSTTNSSKLSQYITQIEHSVSLARANGFVVILSMQDQHLGCGIAHPLPNAATVTAWQHIAPHFAKDPYVMFELFNEPQNNTTTIGWNQWLNGGSTPLSNYGSHSIGQQTLLNDIRTTGANNVVIADGAGFAEELQGIPMLQDIRSGRGIAYAVHPYTYTEKSEQTAWNTRFGYLTATVPVIATEWHYKLNQCGTKAQTLAPTFLSYLQSHHIGILAHAFDVPGFIITGWSWAPTTCGASGNGPGSLIKNFFLSN